MGPRLNESFYPTQTATITYVGTDEDSPSCTCDVDALLGTSVIPIAMDLATSSAATTTTPWAINGAAPGSYRIRVSCTDANNLTGVGLSATFNVSAPPQQVDYATQIQPIWNANCTGMACHDATQSAEGLNLTAAASRAELIGVASSQCSANKRVDPGFPERSYVVIKLQGGGGTCIVGTKMPKATMGLPAAQIQLVRDWIYNGAP